MNGILSNQVGVATQRVNAADEVLSELRGSAAHAEDLAERLSARLASVMMPETPRPQPVEAPAREMPPLFDEYRRLAERIEVALWRIEDALVRLDL